MARRNNLLALFAAVLLHGCSSTGPLNDAEIQARRHLAMADTLERSSSLQEAISEYTFVAEHFPATSVHATAVRKTALLLSAPSNPAANDSAARYWLNVYLNLTRSAEEKQIIHMYLKMVDRVEMLRDSLERQYTISDSLALAVRKHTNEASARSRRVLDLEAELLKASDELKKLKEIDMRISKSKVKNKP